MGVCTAPTQATVFYLDRVQTPVICSSHGKASLARQYQTAVPAPSLTRLPASPRPTQLPLARRCDNTEYSSTAKKVQPQANYQLNKLKQMSLSLSL